jgi:hypothetical protein
VAPASCWARARPAPSTCAWPTWSATGRC